MCGSSSMLKPCPYAPDEMGHVPGAEGGAGDLEALSLRHDRDAHEVGVVTRLLLLALDHVDAALVCDRRGVDEVHVLLDPARQRSVQDRERHQPRVVAGDLALVGDLDAVDRGAAASDIASRPSCEASGM